MQRKSETERDRDRDREMYRDQETETERLIVGPKRVRIILQVNDRASSS